MDQINDGYPDVPPDKFPFAPLEAIARQQWSLANEDREWSDRAFGAMIGKPGRTVGRWRANGYIPWDSADVAAIRLGLHPMLVWPERWMALREASDEELAEAWSQIDRVLAQRDTDTTDDDDGHQKDSIFIATLNT